MHRRLHITITKLLKMNEPTRTEPDDTLIFIIENLLLIATNSLR